MITLQLSLAFFFCLLLAETAREKRPAGAVVYCVWMAILGFLLVENPWIEGGTVVVVGFLMSAMALPKKKTFVGLALSLLFGLVAGFGLLGTEWGGVLLLGLGTLEWRLSNVPAEALLPAKVIDVRPRAEVSWRGFAQLYSACESGEGEKFSRQMLEDTTRVIESCGGKLESGSEHRGVYLFPCHSNREHCQQVLEQYGEQVNGVLGESDLPPVDLTFKRYG